QRPRALHGQPHGHWMDCRNSDRDMAASPRALRGIMVGWRCNQDRLLGVPLPRAPALTLAHARNRKVRDGEPPSPAREPRALPRCSLLKFIACVCGLVFSFWHDTNFLFFVVDERMRWNAFCQEN